MIVFYTPSTQHLLPALPMFEQGKYLSKQFSDGEWYIKLEQDVAGKMVWLIAATNPPADHLLQLWLLLDALQRAGAKINVFFTYYGYARQDRPMPGEASSAQTISSIFKTFSIEKIIILHPHSMLLHNFLIFEAIFPNDLICTIAQNYDAIAAPDQGAYELVKKLGEHCKLETIFLTKIRPEQEAVKILEYDGLVRAKRILIVDDMIATGNTIIEVAKKLKQLGATYVSVWATHGIFSGSARHTIAKNGIEKIYVTDSLPQKNHSSKIEVISIAPLIEQVIKKESS
jgi:ribose-phosphate pyrophosphokinase